MVKRRVAIVAEVKMRSTNFLDEKGVMVQVLSVEEARKVGVDLNIE